MVRIRAIIIWGPEGEYKTSRLISIKLDPTSKWKLIPFSSAYLPQHVHKAQRGARAISKASILCLGRVVEPGTEEEKAVV